MTFTNVMIIIINIYCYTSYSSSMTSNSIGHTIELFINVINDDSACK